jgi:hypothetical protein
MIENSLSHSLIDAAEKGNAELTQFRNRLQDPEVSFINHQSNSTNRFQEVRDINISTDEGNLVQKQSVHTSS